MDDEQQPRSPAFADRHPLIAAALGLIVGAAIGWLVFYLLGWLSFLVIPEGRSEGKGGMVVEAMWFYCGIPVCAVIGAIWPCTIGAGARKRRRAVADRSGSR